ncbi:hypothetical protein [Leptospira terpstrae]|uniref:hypothetical protein n=1 Tax=Leptospira terpstrae TaxID=293075 RepID=UPI001E4C1419|nr:hypothetical protein [Leptospira terpstrae]
MNEGNINLDEFSAYGVRISYAAIQIDNHFYNYFPYGISFLIIPIVAVLNIFIPESFFFQYHGQIEKFRASLLILSSFFFLYNVFSFYISKRKSGFLVVVMGLCTPLFTSGSRALWQHSRSVLLLSISLFLLLVLSFAIQFSAVISKNTQLWNIRGSDINEKPERVWDWNQPQFYPFE